MTVTVTIRPGGARTEIRNLPWTGSPRHTYALLRDAIQASRRGQVVYEGDGVFSVARSHTRELVAFLADRFGRVHVIQHGGVVTCVSSCWEARPDTAILCECSCGGRNHGTGTPLGHVVAEAGTAGELSVAPSDPHEYDVHRGR